MTTCSQECRICRDIGIAQLACTDLFVHVWVSACLTLAIQILYFLSGKLKLKYSATGFSKQRYKDKVREKCRKMVKNVQKQLNAALVHMIINETKEEKKSLSQPGAGHPRRVERRVNYNQVYLPSTLFGHMLTQQCMG